MKALILAAGLGTRLRPYSLKRPKALFAFNGRTLLERLIEALAAAGCTAAIVNTHHLHGQIEAFLAGKRFPIPVAARYEPQILGTGGAIANLADFWDAAPFIVVNADIVTTMDFADLYRFHQSRGQLATMALCDHSAFNTVAVDQDGFIVGFDASAAAARRLTFTGAQVLEPQVLDFIPRSGFSSSIAAFGRLLARGNRITAYIPSNLYWTDVGTPERFRQAVLDEIIPRCFTILTGEKNGDSWQIVKLAGDGSGRTFYRIISGPNTLILADHGLKTDAGWTEVDAYGAIGSHLAACSVPVPKIIAADSFSGLVVMEDLGDVDLQQTVAMAPVPVLELYSPVIDAWLRLALDGLRGFDSAWTCQTRHYDQNLIVDYECRHFVESFCGGHLKKQVDFAALRPCFAAIAGQVLANGLAGLIHRDLQARNVMIRKGSPYFIDFQGARRGPIQYDLASLLIDPYVDLDPVVQETLLGRAMDRLAGRMNLNRHRFVSGYRWCCLTRAMQILGAFGRLIGEGKGWFAPYVPAALKAFDRALTGVDAAVTAPLRQAVDKAFTLR
jgi:aminoglycoside/choline kinase family phosphotransferase/dTDP-glucose pyrophosphorylase